MTCRPTVDIFLGIWHFSKRLAMA